MNEIQKLKLKISGLELQLRNEVYRGMADKQELQQVKPFMKKLIYLAEFTNKYHKSYQVQALFKDPVYKKYSRVD